MNGLMLHSGAAQASLATVHAVATPAETDTWHPVPHKLVIDLIMSNVQALGFRTTGEAHGLWNDGQRYFGLYEIANGHNHEDYSLVVGIRNSHDKSFPAAFAIGSRVFVCDNLAFSGEIVIQRKHTRFIERDLPGLVTRAVGRLTEVRQLQEKRIDAYKACLLGGTHVTMDEVVHNLVIKAVDQGIIANQRIPQVLGEWRKPSHEAFAPRTAWSLFNAFTETLKSISELELPRRTVKLHGMFDGVAGLLTAGQQVEGDAEDVDVRVN